MIDAALKERGGADHESLLQLQEGESIGDYVSRLERRLKELEPPEGFTIQEWHVGQVYSYLLWMPDDVRKAAQTDAGSETVRKWSDRLVLFEERFPSQVKKFSDYMGWNEAGKTAANAS